MRERTKLFVPEIIGILDRIYNVVGQEATDESLDMYDQAASLHATVVGFVAAHQDQ